VTIQPADTGAKPPRYSERTLRRIKHARVTRDTILFLGGVGFVVYGIVVDNAVWIAGLIVAVIFGIAAFMRGMMEPAWDRDWSRRVRWICSIVFVVVGLYFMSYSVIGSGLIGMQGSGTATNCQYFPRHYKTGPDWDCDVNVHWSDGTTTLEQLRSSDEVNTGDNVVYARPPMRYLFLTGDLPVATTPDTAFGFAVGLAFFLQAAFSLGVLIFGKTPPRIADK
jgi:hypothetical protein